MKKIVTALSLSIALLAPNYMLAQDHDDHHDGDRDHRDRDHRDHDDHGNGYYDTRHNDYHQWNGNEDRAYHMYWEQRHRSYVDWDRANARQRQDYWNWRHNHSDALLQINIR